LYESLDARRGRLLVYLANRDYSSAQTELNKAIDLFEKNRDEIDDDEMKTRFFETGHDIYDLGIQLSQHDYKMAFRYSEEGRARSLLDLVRPMGRRPLNGPTTGSNNQPLTLSQIANQIPASAQIIQYSSLSESLYVWVLSSADFFGASQNIRADDLGRKVNEYLECINDPKLDDRATLLAKELYEILIKPVETRLDPDKEIFIVADKPFNNFPFGALIEPATGKFLIEKYTISFSPSSTVFIHCADIARQKESLSVEHCLSVGQSEFNQPELQNSSLPSTKKEAEQVASLYGRNSKLLLDSAATESSLRQEIRDAEVIHIATHNRVNERRPGLSGLALWEEADASTPDNDGRLQAAEISRLKLPRAKLVVLSACQTWIGQDYYGEGMVGMARAFIAAGAPVVVASLWNIDSQTTTKFMDGFHRRRASSGITTARAIREAQIEMLHGGSASYRRPSTWAGFIVVGGYARF
jgi:CHAT domain-containing protein